VASLQDAINKKGSHHQSNTNRQRLIAYQQQMISVIDELIIKDSYHQYAKEFDEQMEVTLANE